MKLGRASSMTEYLRNVSGLGMSSFHSDMM